MLDGVKICARLGYSIVVHQRRRDGRDYHLDLNRRAEPDQCPQRPYHLLEQPSELDPIEHDS